MSLLNVLIQAVLKSKWGRRNANLIGAFLLGVWVQGTYYREIRAVLQYFGVERQEYLKYVVALAGVVLAAGGVGLSALSDRRKAKKGGTDD
jgi:hypothetical protein